MVIERPYGYHMSLGLLQGCQQAGRVMNYSNVQQKTMELFSTQLRHNIQIAEEYTYDNKVIGQQDYWPQP